MASRTSLKSALSTPEGSLDDYPPFPGFDEEAFKFLRDLKRNNRREWMTTQRKEIYQLHLLEPTRCLLSELRERFITEEFPFFTAPKRSILRIYPDTRFPQAQPPFQTNLGS